VADCRPAFKHQAARRGDGLPQIGDGLAAAMGLAAEYWSRRAKA
jgi:hypothetical protein